MQYKKLALVVLAPLLWTSLISAKPNENLREIYRLCSRFPYNSRCEGYEVPIPLDYRSGEAVACSLALREREEKPTGHCKMAIADGALTIYVEEGEPIELLENQRASRELKIPADHLFALTYVLWNEVSGNLFDLGNRFSVVNNDFASLEIAFLTDSTAPGNHSNLLRFIGKTDAITALRDQLASSITSDKLSQSDLIAASAPSPAPSVENQVKQLLETKVCIRCDLRGANLEKADLDGANLEGANLQGANLNKAELKRAYLIGANFDGATLTDVEFNDAKLLYASLANVNLTSAELRGANLQSANLQGATLIEADLTAPAILQNANLKNANLTRALLGGANLEQANLEAANLEGADLSDLKLETSPNGGIGFNAGEVFAGLVLGTDSIKNFKFNTNLSGANLTGANLNNADLEDAILSNANLSNASLKAADLNDVDLTDVNLCGATMPDGTQSNQGCAAGT